MTRSSSNWITKPGSFDTLNTARRFPARSPFGIPDLEPQSFDLPAAPRLRPYRSRLDRLDPSRDICHFYLDDYRFETTWNRPEVGWRHVSSYFATCTPDFSLYPTWPVAMQIWQTYRARWLARFWRVRMAHSNQAASASPGSQAPLCRFHSNSESVNTQGGFGFIGWDSSNQGSAGWTSAGAKRPARCLARGPPMYAGSTNAA